MYPFGHWVVPPPKQRGMPLESSLQTALWPSQQSWGAAMDPPSGRIAAPHSSPSDWQPEPLLQRPGVPGGEPLGATHTTDPFGLVPPPQQSWFVVQKSPLRRHPVADWHTVAPNPPLTHKPEQQLVLFTHGLPSCVHPPDPPPVMKLQSAGPPPAPPVQVPPQQSPQQSEFLKQMSLLAWQKYAATQSPPWQFVEQHCEAEVHA